MESILASLLAPYQEYSSLNIFLEATAVLFGLLSVWFSKKNNIWVYPSGIVSTLIFVYLLYNWGLLGDMLINAYYFSMSIYGWYYWTRKTGTKDLNPISKMSQSEFRMAQVLFIFALLFVFLVYTLFDKWNHIIAYIDTFTTAIFFVGMWLMARRKIENWLFWIVGDLISIPLYYVKGYSLTSIQYLIFTLVAVAGYYAWKKELNERD
ncbi:MAG: nicotinamide mononucleotide transporter [Crocinitomicaceae bacterium]|nr:nicotinamide mononucleotide transporter [Crocinitomicaceae bacterium]|tara:strand:- start:20 stop:643 length:624 start_codon:yes stop_codon:yes gene_type:complete